MAVCEGKFYRSCAEVREAGFRTAALFSCYDGCNFCLRCTCNRFGTRFAFKETCTDRACPADKLILK